MRQRKEQGLVGQKKYIDFAFIFLEIVGDRKAGDWKRVPQVRENKLLE